MTISRRSFLASAAVLACGRTALAGTAPARMGIGISSYVIRGRVERDKGFSDPLRFAAFCRERGAGGVQVPIGVRDADYARKLRAYFEEQGMFLEGSTRTPRDKADVERFESEVRTARAAGATVMRTVMLSGRRYETFRAAREYQDFKKRSLASLELAEPVLARHRMRLAVENHKDYRMAEQVELMSLVSSEHVGICVDTGNNIALLEDALQVVKLLAPWAMSCHLKDMAVEEYPDGFLLSEVPLGEGALDLKQIVETLRKTRPEVRFNLEMLTRDPLQIPCLTEPYWATFPEVPGIDLARTLAWVRKHAGKKLPRIGELDQARQLEAEESHVRRSIDHARKELGM
jgi:sugar phosphate isomerase/epimerase